MALWLFPVIAIRVIPASVPVVVVVSLLLMIWLFIASFVVVIVSAIVIHIPVVVVPDVVATPAIVKASSVVVIGVILGIVRLSLVAFPVFPAAFLTDQNSHGRIFSTSGQ